MVTMFRGRHDIREEQASQHEHRKSGNGDANDINSVAQSIPGPAVLEIEKLITQLHDMRDHLVYERQRVERAITECAQMSRRRPSLRRSSPRTWQNGPPRTDGPTARPPQYRKLRVKDPNPLS